ncbi:2-octaprenyl-3-methyl-6-methoxy-1,4-benzoquinol hydroxylase [Ascidiaceihabitans donghaensis]|uniref:2-octaprenyl-3-methyl-6-methoxy-1,4-benzoquinol hydroxylase n=1 Tax=Ascidiaceihabitans donghaensis TaxID=1510460 RepID=A0A2R8BFL9_9RHOB|nr:UbiH/UbiF family hydroxylase [Ascidiaceihabitans donghaensis]SPH21861.1 2-octaprenyl-3-methyl-6-methoxy-1,4-benzoquinol hydroxylase [Ascidiaceihabitans donghaensis]
MTNQTCDIVISGGGIAGLTAAAAFGAAGFHVICVDPTPPVTQRDAVGADMRTTAMLQPARRVLQDAGIWDHIAPYSAALQIMRIVDAGGPTPTARITKEFNAADISDAPFGWNFPNYILRREILNRLDHLDTVDFRPGTATTTLFTRTKTARVGLSDGSKINTKMVIAADGRASPMRQAAGIDVTTKRYGQKALAFAVTHTVPHENVSTEIHRTGGPFTSVPLPDYEGKPCSAVVWMDDGPKSQARYNMDVAAFEAEMTTRSCGLFGPLTLASNRTIWPIISQTATEMRGQRVALIAEAAHVMPPIGAQGLNMSLQDTATLLELAKANPDGLGGADMLDAYQKARLSDVRLRVTGIDLLNRASQVAHPALRDARAMGLNAIYGLGPVRKTLMQMGLGTGK